ncbi:tRNA pseudouridine38-40 synthase, partial [Pancytospora epiphaga]
NETNDDKCNRLNESNENNSASSEEQVTEGKAKTFGYRKYSIKDLEEISGYRAQNIEVFRRAMKKYVGTHNFGNFTAKTHSKEAKRFIRSIFVSEPIVADNVEYVEVTIHGQSFLLHQIRKMVLFAVLNTRYSSDRIDENFEKAFSQPLHIPKAPSQYLYLSSILFDDYNQRAVEKIEIDENDRVEFEKEILSPLIYKQGNLYEWLKLFDAIRYHHENFEIFKQ